MLLAKNALWGDTGWSSRLPDRQWELEAFNMHNISLAHATRCRRVYLADGHRDQARAEVAAADCLPDGSRGSALVWNGDDSKC